MMPVRIPEAAANCDGREREQESCGSACECEVGQGGPNLHRKDVDEGFVAEIESEDLHGLRHWDLEVILPYSSSIPADALSSNLDKAGENQPVRPRRDLHFPMRFMGSL
eukprot:768305-Hanusia_phi.AAC.7